ncbi:putative PPE family protein PPE42 [Mycobacterium marinum]|uniref:Putative PPE family protein PPE42 n=1 Tax=Mycobacterium marinum TaxID=1781 RepID=A0A3E2MP82_MYCMR|nr:PE-PPE domain-containing protein [Mycobacterium marinum]RFZ33259.1 putative PPE family protein PPE42 [Mycobacterium marinum]
MSYVITAPEMLTTAATDLDGIGSAIKAASAAVAGPTTGVAAAAADEVSGAIAKLFGMFGQEYQSVVAQAGAFQTEFTRLLATAGESYAITEASNALGALNTQAQTLLGGAFGTAAGTSATAPLAAGTHVAFVMGGTAIPWPDATYVTAVQDLFIDPHFPGFTTQVLFTPEQLWPFTSNLGSLTFGQSVAQGVAILRDALSAQLSDPANTAVVFGYSQSATIATNQIRAFMSQLNPPSPSQLSFVLTGNPNNPDGGVLERFNGLYLPIVDVLFNGATPPDSPYPTAIYTAQYDGIANFPRYPLNVVSDVNAIMGFLYDEHYYAGLTSDPNAIGSGPTVANAVQLPTSPGYTGNTEYYMVLAQHLPLTDPLRQIPYVGTPIADLIQPSLRVIVDLGYSDYGPGQNYADIPTPASLFSLPNPLAVSYYLGKGAVQGVQAFMVDEGWLPQSYLPDTYPYVASLSPGLNVYLGQPSVTGLSLLTGALGTAARDLGWIPSWD